MGEATAQGNFTDASRRAGLDATTGPNHGINLADYDGDGDDDFFVGRLSATNWLFRNNGDGTFSEVGAAAGIAGSASDQTYGACWGDLDNDGDQDLYVGNPEAPDQLFENRGDGTFRDITTVARITNLGAPRSVNFADVNRDGLLDIYVTNFRQENALYLNLGGLRFSDQTQERSAGDTGISMGSIFVDYDRDGDADLYLTHDNRQPNLLLQNDGNGYFTDVSQTSGTNLGGFGMGVDVGDVNNDGWPDLYVTNLHDNFLFLNQGNGTFKERGAAAGVNDYGMGWGTLFLDYDNDGRQDIYVVNNSYFSPYPNLLYRNLGRDSFADTASLLIEGSPYGGYAAGSFDFNKDGKLDLLLTNTGETGGLQYFENVTPPGHHWISLRLEGSTSNRDAIGTLLTLETASATQIREITAGSGYAAQSSRWQHFGLGADTLIRQLTIQWPSGKVEKLMNLAVNQFLPIREGGNLTSNTGSASPALKKLTVGPIPTSGAAQITWTATARETVLLKLLSLSGQVLNTWSLAVVPGEQSFSVSLRDHPPGTYLLQLPGYSLQRIMVQ